MKMPTVRTEVLALCCVYISLHLAQAFTDQEKAQAVKVLNNLSQSRQGLSTLQAMIDSIDSTLKDKQKRWPAGCNLGAGMPGYQCHLAALRSDAQSGDWLTSSQMSPGKRSANQAENDDKAEYKRDVNGKRTCAFNLGGHCATENAASFARQWNYLNSNMSPGRRRRSAENKELVPASQSEDSMLLRKLTESLQN